MDMQNVSNLEIPEGEVRTIHDKDSVLLWGRVNYDTKYAGDTFQQTYSGKNICSETKVENATKNLFFKLPTLSSGDIVLSCTPGTVLTGATYGLLIDGTFTQLGTWSTNSSGKLIKSISLTAEQVADVNAGTDVWIRTYKSAGGFVVPDDAMIEYGTVATAYEPYVGGTASPSPDYPQEIQTVKGEQNVLVRGKNVASPNATMVWKNNAQIQATPIPSGINLSHPTNGANKQALFSTGINLSPYKGKTVYMRTSFSPSNGGEYRLNRTNISGGNRVSMGSTTISGRLVSFEVPQDLGDSEYLGFSLIMANDVSRSVDFTNLIITIDNSDTTYEAYQSNDFPMSLTGKNLFNKDATPQGGYLATYSALSTGVRATAASAINYTYIRYVMNVENYVGQTFTLSATASASASNLPAINMGICDADGNNRVQKVIQTGTGELTVSYTIASGDQYIYFAFYANQVGTASVGDYADYADAQLEIGPATAYEPYFTPIELAKIGDYQDYIYEGSDGWYVHKNIGKVVYDGTQAWNFEGGDGGAFFRTEPAIATFTVDKYAISDKLLAYDSTNALAVWTRYPYNVVAIRNRTTYAQIGIKTDVASTSSDFRTWLASNPTTVYYVLQTPTDTQITDATLISQLEALHEWMVRYGYYGTVSGNLPMIIKRTALS